MQHDTIAVMDFGGQYAHLIAAKIRRLHVLAEIVQPEDSADKLAAYKGIILSGSPSLASHDEDSAYDKRIYDLPIPILGFCFGHQEVAKRYGGSVEHTQREYGPVTLEVRGASPIFAGLSPRETVFQSHGDTVTVLPDGFEEVGVTYTEGGEPHRYAAIAHDGLKRYGFQFHPEVDDSVEGERMLDNFVRICGCARDWTMETFGDEEVERIRKSVGTRPVFLLASGGVDSTVCAVLLGKALGPDRVHLLHIDNGLMRKDESANVVAELGKRGLEKNLHFADASSDFLQALAGVVEPEAKRRIIGNTFIRIFEREASRLDLRDCVLAQGTIYPDTIETGGSKRADVIKTHHNRVPMIHDMIAQGRVVEPLADLYKVEVRELGESLGLPEEMVWRHPFPGPGLGIRLLCSDGVPSMTKPGADEVLAKLVGEARLSGTILPVRSVGVKADLRSYEQPVMLWGDVSWDKAESFATRIYQEVPSVNRCIVDLTGKGVSRARPLAATVTRERLDLLREADHAVMTTLRKHGLYRLVWQCPTVFVPLEIDGQGRELVVIRPVLSERAMTCRPAMLAPDVLFEMRDAILALPGISGVALDVTTKPPGTIEWE